MAKEQNLNHAHILSRQEIDTCLLAKQGQNGLC